MRYRNFTSVDHGPLRRDREGEVCCRAGSSAGAGAGGAGEEVRGENPRPRERHQGGGGEAAAAGQDAGRARYQISPPGKLIVLCPSESPVWQWFWSVHGVGPGPEEVQGGPGQGAGGDVLLRHVQVRPDRRAGDLRAAADLRGDEDEVWKDWGAQSDCERRRVKAESQDQCPGSRPGDFLLLLLLTHQERVGLLQPGVQVQVEDPGDLPGQQRGLREWHQEWRVQALPQHQRRRLHWVEQRRSNSHTELIYICIIFSTTWQSYHDIFEIFVNINPD